MTSAAALNGGLRGSNGEEELEGAPYSEQDEDDWNGK